MSANKFAYQTQRQSRSIVQHILVWTLTYMVFTKAWLILIVTLLAVKLGLFV